MSSENGSSTDSIAAHMNDIPDGGPPPASWLRRLSLRLLLVVVPVLAALVLLEAGLWVLAPKPFGEWAIWESEGHIRGRLMPNQIVYTATGHKLRVNRHGFRGPDYSFEKAPGTLRIEVFGGSAAFCFKAAGREKSWPGALEIKLRERLKMPVEVINLGLPGFTAFDSKINYLCYGRAFDPDAIIVYHTINDLSRFRPLEKTPYQPAGTPKNKPLWARIARKTQIGRRIRFATFNLFGWEMDIRTTGQEGTGADLDRPVHPRAFAWERQCFVDFVEWAQRDGVLPILSSQAFLLCTENIDDPEVRKHVSGGVTSRGFTLPLFLKTWFTVSKMIEEVAREHDAIFVDGYKAVPHDLEHIRDHVHLFDRGSEVLAEEFALVLLADPQFLKLADRVRAESAITSN